MFNQTVVSVVGGGDDAMIGRCMGYYCLSILIYYVLLAAVVLCVCFYLRIFAFSF